MAKISATSGKIKPVSTSLFEAVKPGEFYIGVFPGHFTCPITGIIIRGPIVNVGGITGMEILSIASLPDPVQIPHKKHVVIVDKNNKQTESDVDFDASGDSPLHAALNLAVSTGQIRHVPEAEMEKYFPEAYAAREENLVFSKIRYDVSMEEVTAKFLAEKLLAPKPLGRPPRPIAA